jgi:hypothetical protein
LDEKGWHAVEEDNRNEHIMSLDWGIPKIKVPSTTPRLAPYSRNTPWIGAYPNWGSPQLHLQLAPYFRNTPQTGAFPKEGPLGSPQVGPYLGNGSILLQIKWWGMQRKDGM